jgi:hypothetical protein
MKRILRIFRKDAGRLWPQALVFLAITAAAAALVFFQVTAAHRAINPVPGRGAFASLFVLLPVLQPLACWVLVIALIHEERLIGHEQYWLTRPYSWRDLLAAKALFLVAFVNLPLFVCQFATLAAAGISPIDWLPALLWRQVFFSIFFILPAVAMGAVTRNLGQVVLAAVLMYLVLLAGVQAVSHNPDWGGFDWIRTSGVALVMAGGTAAVVALQYARRRTAVARGIMAATFVLTVAAFFMPVWGGAFTIQKIFSRHAVGESAVRLSFDESRAGAHPMNYGRSSNDPDGARLEIPLRVDNVPDGMLLGADWTSVGVEAPNDAWHSGWLTFRAFHSLSQGKAWLTVYVNPGFYERAQDAPVRLYGALDLALYQRVGTIIAPGSGEVIVPEIGLCTFSPSFGPWGLSEGPGPVKHVYVPETRVVSESPFQKLAITPLGLDDELLGGGPYAPFPVSPGFRPFEDAHSWTTQAHSVLAFDRPVAFVQRTFQVRGVRMRDYHLMQ